MKCANIKASKLKFEYENEVLIEIKNGYLRSIPTVSEVKIYPISVLKILKTNYSGMYIFRKNHSPPPPSIKKLISH